ncbi:MAG: glycerate kinase [Geodermatophilaceae bacterium]|nr:glycerate kinase [Geodermatophilaceae bacterium]
MPSHPTVLLALDKFKGCLDAADVCAELSRGILDAGLAVKVVLRPVADGGDATLDAALAAGFLRRPSHGRGSAG